MTLNETVRPEQAWQDIYEQVTAGKDDPVKEYVVQVSGSYVIEDVTALRYFPLVAGRLYSENVISARKTLVLNVDVRDLSEEKSIEAYKRLQAFLWLMPDIPYLSVRVGNHLLKRNSDLWGWSDVFPICGVDAGRQGGTCDYKCLRENFFDRKQRQNKPNVVFARIANAMLGKLQDPELYKGSKDDQIRAEKKQELADTVSTYIFRHLGDMDILSQIVWLYFVIELVILKQMVDLEKGCTVREYLLRKTRMDAESYAEAMYQAIENACLHSGGKRAWFGFRIHKAQRSASMRELRKETRTRSILYQKYKECFSDQGHVWKNIFDSQSEDYGYYFEFYVLDYVLEGQGITATFNKNNGQNFSHITDVVHRDCKKADPGHVQEHVEDVVQHYGLRLLQRIVAVNHGYLQGFSPNGTVMQRYYSDVSEFDRREDGDTVDVTEWDVLLPIALTWDNEVDECAAEDDPGYGLNDEVRRAPAELIYLNRDDIFTGMEEESGKWQKICRIEENLIQHIESGAQEERIFLFNPEMDVSEIELFAKGVFAAISSLSCRETGDVCLRIALLMPDAASIQEFIRFFSAFYFDGKQEDMRGVQIALCMESTVYDGTYTVQFILDGVTLSDAFDNARQFAYFAPEDSVEHLPMLRYLMSEEGTPGSPKSSDRPKRLFPFDLYLPQVLPDQRTTSLPLGVGKETWFTRRVRVIMTTSMEEKEYGCYLDDIHIRLGSKVHMNRFYEAEMLFHDAGIVERFAYLIAYELIFGDRNPLEEDKNILLVGYEKYSTQLLLRIEQYLKAADKFTGVYTSMVYEDDNEEEVVLRRYFWREELALAQKSLLQIVSALPIGTTLSTIYKMTNAAKRELSSLSGLRSVTNRDINFCLILVNSDLLKDSGNGNDTTKIYWEDINRSDQVVTVRQERKEPGGNSGAKVNYLIRMEGDWMEPESCPLCTKRDGDLRPVIRARHSNTVPASIFRLNPGIYSHKSLLKAPDAKTNKKRMKNLFHNIHYSHLCSANNHFQFYIDHQDLYQENRDDIDAWLRTCSVDRNAYHVLISPLQITNSAFLKAVVDHVFKGNVALLHFDVKDTYREEMRSKYSYITENYRRLKKENQDARFCIHFADTSIVTGSNLNRVRLLANMLLAQSGMPSAGVAYFDRVFLLVNRCNYYTIRSFVRDPENDLYKYINLEIPSFNTENDFCPSCKQQEKYALLGKRTSTQMMWEEFSRLSEKHMKRGRDEYLTWRKERMMESASDFSALMQFLQVCVPDGLKGSGAGLPLSYIQKETEQYFRHHPWRLGITVLESAYGVKEVICAFLKQRLGGSVDIGSDRGIQDYLGRARGACLGDAVRFARGELASGTSGIAPNVLQNFEADAGRILFDLQISVRDYMRLVSMEEAYEALGGLQDVPVGNGGGAGRSRREDIKARRDVILNLISKRCVMRENQSKKIPQISPLKNRQERDAFALAYNVEWMISYIKVLSRAQLSNYYNTRCAISGIMSDMLVLVSDTRSDAAREKYADALKKENGNWMNIIRVLDEVGNRDNKNDSALKIRLHYRMYMTLIHRLSDQQIKVNTCADDIYFAVRTYDRLCSRYRTWKDGSGKGQYPLVALPTAERMVLRYMKSLKLAAMVSNDLTPGLRLTDVPGNLLEKRKGESPDVSAILQMFSRYIYLENTQVLYLGMRNLRKRIPDERKREPQEFTEVFHSLYETVRERLVECYRNLDGEAKQEDILMQNILSKFCVFWHRSMECAPISLEGNESLAQITAMLMYYRQLDMLADNMQERKPEDIPYYYEELCRMMCRITGFAMCYIAYDEEGSNCGIFTQSGCHAGMLLKDRLLTTGGLKEVLYRAGIVWENTNRAVDCQTGDRNLTSNIAVLQKNGESDFLVIRLPVHAADGHESGFYVIFQSLTFGSSEDDQDKFEQNMLQKARNILFMREKLQKVLNRDYTVLMSFRFDFSYVRKMRKKSAAVPPSALHLSDLHIRSDATNLSREVQKSIKDNLKRREVESVDFLIVSGDIIDSRDANAAVIERNYSYAEQLLKNVVSELWEDAEGYLPGDWKKRVIITTGNHDYASMNQYQAKLKGRSLTAAMPSEADSNTMAKFTYYIEFLTRFLDMPLDELLRNDLNEVRHYRRMNIRVLVLNCSGRATAQRTNKIGVSREKLEPLLWQKQWRAEPEGIGTELPYRICVAHYSPEYDLSYFLDQYPDEIPGWSWDPGEEENCRVNQLVGLFRDLMCEEVQSMGKPDAGELKEKREEFRKFMKQLEDVLSAIEHQNNIRAIEEQMLFKAIVRHVVSDDPEFNRKAREEAAKMRKCSLYCQMILYRDWLEKQVNGAAQGERDVQDTSNERVMKMMYEIARSVLVSDSDKREFEKLMGHVVESYGGSARDDKTGGNGGEDQGAGENRAGRGNPDRRIDLYLTGHVHSYAESKTNQYVKLILVSDRLYWENISGINGYIIKNMCSDNLGRNKCEYFRLG